MIKLTLGLVGIQAVLWPNSRPKGVTHRASVTFQPDCRPFNLLDAGIINKRQYKTSKAPDLLHINLLTML